MPKTLKPLKGKQKLFFKSFASGEMVKGGNVIPTPPTFHPTLAQLADWEGFVATMEEAGAHRVGIAKLIMPEGWQPRKKGYNLSNLNLEVDKLLTQKIKPIPTKVQGAFSHETSLFNRSNKMSVANYLAMASSSQHQPPDGNFQQLDQKYWERHYDPNSSPPVYGADIRGTLMDPELEVFNLDKINSRPDAILFQDQGPEFGGVHDSYIFLGMWASTFSWHVEDQVPNPILPHNFYFCSTRTCMGSTICTVEQPRPGTASHPQKHTS